MLATYFPKPLNPLMGTWALDQAKALQRQGATVEVVSFTAWVPPLVAATRGAKAYAHCPRNYDWNGLIVHYPRWPLYPVGAMRKWSETNPRPFLDGSWLTVRGWLDRKIAEYQPDLVFAHHSAVNGYLGELIRRRHSIPFVVTDHDFGEIRSCEERPKRRALYEAVAGGASRMVAVARQMEQEILRLFPRAPACTVHAATDPIPEELHRQPRPDDFNDKVVVFSCGHFCARKGIPLLIDAFASVANRHPDALLRIAGDGAERPRVEERIKAHRLEGQVQLLGSISHDAVLQEMVWADVFALIGWDEPFATVYSEAASAGKPILCCNDGGFNDVLVPEVHGLTVPPRNVEAATTALDRLVSDEQLRRTLGANAQALFESQLKWDHNAARMLEIFEEAVGSSSAR